MALTAKAIKELARRAGVSEKDLKAAIEAEAEQEITIDDTLQIFSAADLEARDNNNISTGKKEGEKVGEVKGKELAAKALRTKLALDTDSKDIEEIAKLANEKIKADDGAKSQISLLQKDLQERDAKIANLEGTTKSLREDYELINLLPKNINPAIPASVVLATVKARIEFKEEGTFLDGKPLTHAQTRAALGKKEAIQHFFEQEDGKALLATVSKPGGREGDDEGGGGSGGKFKNMTEWTADFEKRNPGLGAMSEQGVAEITAYMEKNPDFNMNE